jgi:hypothetical protein
MFLIFGEGRQYFSNKKTEFLNAKQLFLFMQHGNAVPLVIEKLKERASDLVKALNLIYK